jgi:hypothetical protein
MYEEGSLEYLVPPDVTSVETYPSTHHGRQIVDLRSIINERKIHGLKSRQMKSKPVSLIKV